MTPEEKTRRNNLPTGTRVATTGNHSGRIEGCTVVAVGSNAFFGHTTIYTVRLPSGAERDYLAGDVYPTPTPQPE